MPKSPKPIASLSMDLDDKWTYLKTHGDPSWQTYPSYLETVVPRVLQFLRERNLKITFFLVGQDARLPHNREVLRSLADAGHEIGNHSLRHEPWLHLYTPEEIRAELATAESAIEDVTGQRPIGFRGPGFSVCDQVIETLLERNYLYDASTFPTFLGPLARLYYFFTAKLDAQEKEKRSQLFGTWRDGLRPLKAHVWRTAAGSMIELPVTTIPILRTPFHLSYLLYLSTVSKLLANVYLKLALFLCRLRSVEPSFLLHPLDFLSPAEAPELAFFPAMHLSLNHKLEVASQAFATFERHYQVVSMQKHARSYESRVIRHKSGLRTSPGNGSTD